MKLDIKRNTKRGIAFGLIYKIIATLLPFAVQTVFIRLLGIEYVGVKGLFTSVLTFFSLAELGFGSAIVFSMYRPIAEENKDKLCALLKLYKTVYRVIGLVILALGLLMMPFLRYLVQGSYPADINIHIVFLLYVIQTVLSYWLFAYKSSLLQAYQRMDIVNIVDLIITILTSSAQIAVLVIIKNFYAFLIISIVTTVIKNIVIAIVVNHLYPEVKCRGTLTSIELQDIKKKVAGVFIEKVCGTTRNTFDSIFISAFLGLTQAGIYSNYFYILTALNGFTTIISSALLAGIGNRIVLEGKEKNYKEMMSINRLYLLISGWMSACMLCLYQPFMNIWAGADNLFPNYVMVLFPLYFYIQKMGDIRGVYSDAAGLFWENRWRTIAEAVANIVLNYLLVKYLGVFGILLATVITLFFIGFLGSSFVIFKHYFLSGRKEYFLSEAKFFFITVIVCVVCWLICGLIPFESTPVILLIRGVVCVTVAPILYWLILHRSKDYVECKEWVVRMIRS